MSIAQAVKFSRKIRGLKQDELTDVGYSLSMVGMIERGDRTVAEDVAPTLAKRLDHPAMYFETARELTGGFGPAWLNGPNVDTHRASVREKCIEELTEAMESIHKVSAAIPPTAETTSDHKRRWAHLLQVMDAVQACYMYIGVQCEEYGFSMMQLSQEHFAKLRGKRYVEA